MLDYIILFNWNHLHVAVNIHDSIHYRNYYQVAQLTVLTQKNCLYIIIIIIIIIITAAILKGNTMKIH